MDKLPIKNILTETFIIPWSNKGVFINALSLPALSLVTVWATWVFVNPETHFLNISFSLLYLFAFSYFAVTCHRLILLKDKTQHSYNTIRIIFFLKWAVIIYGLLGVFEVFIKMAILTVMMNTIKNFNHDNIINFKGLLYLPLMYYVGRFSLIFPATALDLKGSLKWSWNATRNNGINILCVVGLFPWIMYFLFNYGYRDDATIIEQAIMEIFSYFIAAFEIFALSLTYRALQLNAQK